MHYMHFLLDVLEVVSELSLEYQNDSTSLPDVFEALDVAMTKLIALKQRPGRHLESFIDGTGSQLTFHGVKLNKSDLKKEKIIEKENSLLLSVMDHISGNTNRQMTDLINFQCYINMPLYILLHYCLNYSKS